MIQFNQLKAKLTCMSVHADETELMSEFREQKSELLDQMLVVYAADTNQKILTIPECRQ